MLAFDPAAMDAAARLFGEDLPAIFPDGDEIWVYQSAGLDILSDGTYDLEVDASLTLPDTVYVGLLLGSGTWDRSPLSNSVLTMDVVTAEKPDTVIVAVGAKIELPTLKGLEPHRALVAEEVLAGNIKVGQKVMVIGCGPVGLAVTAALRLAGVETIVGSDFSSACATATLRAVLPMITASSAS